MLLHHPRNPCDDASFDSPVFGRVLEYGVALHYFNYAPLHIFFEDLPVYSATYNSHPLIL
jgi:hypothetical protein